MQRMRKLQKILAVEIVSETVVTGGPRMSADISCTGYINVKYDRGKKKCVNFFFHICKGKSMNGIRKGKSMNASITRKNSA